MEKRQPLFEVCGGWEDLVDWKKFYWGGLRKWGFLREKRLWRHNLQLHYLGRRRNSPLSHISGIAHLEGIRLVNFFIFYLFFGHQTFVNIFYLSIIFTAYPWTYVTLQHTKPSVNGHLGPPGDQDCCSDSFLCLVLTCIDLQWNVLFFNLHTSYFHFLIFDLCLSLSGVCKK